MELLLNEILKQSANHSHFIIFFDYDGTLTPIVSNPAKATLSAKTRKKLKTISQIKGVTLGIVTGRSLQDIKEFVQLKDIIYITNHGYLIEDHGELIGLHDRFNKQKHYLSRYDKVIKQLKDFPDIYMEKKEVSTAFHYRNVPSDKQEKCHKQILKLLKTFFAPKEAKIKEGKMVIELLPTGEIDKGTSIEFMTNRLKERFDFDDPFIIFLGDDKTDEDGFIFLNSINKITVKVGKEATAAKFRLKDSKEVDLFINELIDILEYNSPESQLELF